MLLARHGMAALCHDPIGQGERYQMLDTTRERSVFDDAPHVKTPHPFTRLVCTTEHTMMGIGSALLGENVAQFRTWDAMRVIDYLQSRPDILADKIGFTGNSGGGTETAYAMALDDRIAAAAPGCFLTTFRKLLETKGPQDGEQNIFGQIAFGMDEADYCIMRAPRPTLICAGTRDVTFDFNGTWDLFREAKRFYSRLGHADAIDLAAPDAPHGFTLQLREAVTRFMARHLLGKDMVVRERESLPDTFTDDELRALSPPDWTAEQLQCTPRGQVLLLPGERSVFQINADRAAALKRERAATWGKLDGAEKNRVIRETIGAPSRSAEARVETIGTIERPNCVIHKLVLTAESGLPLPALAFVPRKPNGKTTLYLHGTSMKEDAAPGGPIDALVNEGRIVLAAEMRGIGETETGFSRKAYGAGRFGRDLLEVLTAYLMGQSYVGLRTTDMESWTRWLQSPELTGTRPDKLDLIAIGEATVPALHAAALNRDTFATITLRRMIPSWETLVAAPETFDQAVNMVHGALKHYDLPDLVRFIGEEKVTIAEPVDGMGVRVR
jgi:dienelactone hydrolase